MVTLAGRFPASGSALGLLAAVLLVVSMVDCSMAQGHVHIHHTSAVSGVEHVTLSLMDEHGPAVTHDVIDGHCVAHFDHCLAKAVPRGAAENLASQLLIFALTLAFLAVVGLRGITPSGVRGPPVSRLPVADGRAMLTQFCIARC
ncbi:putative copper homeostasis (lipo)protein LpqS [Nocardia gipuzkoensis]